METPDSESAARLSIREISRRTGVPESTLRYYRDLFPEYIPTAGSGRGRRHPESAVPVFRRVAELFGAGGTRDTVRSELEAPDSWTGSPRPLVPQWAERPSGPTPQGLDAREAGGLPVERLIAAMLAGQRELHSMHRELLQAVGAVLGALQRGTQGGGSASDGDTKNMEGPPVPARAELGAEAPIEGPMLRHEVAELRRSLDRERETVERLRRAKLRLEQRLAQLDGRDRRDA